MPERDKITSGVRHRSENQKSGGRELIETFRGPLGSHRNYLVHVALPNYTDYFWLKKGNEEKGRSGTRDKYKAFRYFLNAVESLNNVLDYLYFEHEDRVKRRSVGEFRKTIHNKYPDLGELAELANAYKHCVREKNGKKNEALLWARDLQRPAVSISVTPGNTALSVAVDYDFPWPIKEHDSKLDKAFEFWLNYHNNPKTNELINV
jgi:hypothetical protein